ncbi:MAG TPA: SUMF1/EgtB/PvdO family nonheme iron enzyme, partial [Thermotogota bacterium]|nr:SUMF1/EgtB/PvdO family nonheme iron enzyme [Thermotogota bacterium]
SVTVGSHNQVSLEAQPEEDWAFEGWYDGSTKLSDTLLFQVEATQDKTYTAKFSEIPDFTLTAQSDPASGGDVRINEGSWGDQKSVTVQRGTLVELEAQPEDGWEFDGWYEGETQLSETLLYQVEAQANRTFQAKFTEIPTYTITAQSDPASGGDVRINEGEWEDETSVTVRRNTEVTLEADAANGWNFNGWYEGSTKVSDNAIFQVVAEEDKSYSAKFREQIVWYTITAQSDPGNGGDVRVNGGTWGDNKSATVEEGSQVTLEASPTNGWRFDGWYSGSTLVCANASYQVTATSNKTYSARFKENLTFWMGNTRGDGDGHPNEEPVHGVYFTYTFWISPYEVTFNDYDAYCADTGATYPFDNKWGRGTRPVIYVSWWDALRYCNWLSEQQGYARAYNEST